MEDFPPQGGKRLPPSGRLDGQQELPRWEMADGVQSGPLLGFGTGSYLGCSPREGTHSLSL